MSLDLETIARLANTVRLANCEPGTDRDAYEIARAASDLLAEVESLRKERDEIGTELRSALETLDIYEAEIEKLNRTIEEGLR